MKGKETFALYSFYGRKKVRRLSEDLSNLLPVDIEDYVEILNFLFKVYISLQNNF